MKCALERSSSRYPSRSEIPKPLLTPLWVKQAVEAEQNFGLAPV